MNIKTLYKIARALNDNNISWGLGASSMLYFHGLVDTPRDIDLMVDEQDARRAVSLLSEYASSVQTDDGKGKYATKYFYEMVIDGQDVDLIGGYRILRDKWIYDFPILKELDMNTKKMDDLQIPLTHIEDWYIAYLIMGDPKGRIPLIESYVNKQGGFEYQEQLIKAAEQIEKKAPFETELIQKIRNWTSKN